MMTRILVAWALTALWPFGVSPLASEAAETIVGDPAALARAIKAAWPGDTILIADGTWRDATIVFAAEGEDGKPITLRRRTREKSSPPPRAHPGSRSPRMT